MTQKVVVKPTVSAFESQYKENYVLWTGPFKTVKTVQTAEPLLVNFADLVDDENNTNFSGSLNNGFADEEVQTGELPANEVIRNRR